MDGVLVDAKEWHYLALNRALAKYNYEISFEEHLSTFDGLPTREKLRILSERGDIPSDVHSEINDLKQKFTIECANELCRPVLHIKEALQKLKFDGYMIAVCSNSIRHTIDLFMEKSGLTPFLDLVVSNQDVQKSKPAPDIYLKAMDYFNLLPKEVLICEDNFNGIRAAIASGGNLLKINDISDTNYENIKNRILELDD